MNPELKSPPDASALPRDPAATVPYRRDPDERITLAGYASAFYLIHLLPLLAILTGVSWFDVGLCVALYAVRMWFMTAGYHRYFSHRSYKTSRFVQFLLAFGGTTSIQKGVLWWAATHRHHHKYSDTPDDIHSPRKGFWWSHCLWFLCRKYNGTDFEAIRDFARYPELRFLNRFHIISPFLLGTAVWLGCGWRTGTWDPFAAWSGLLIGFFLSTVLLWHGTFTINSLSHVFGRRRYATGDTSRNSMLLALLTHGEGWHNNHHYYQSAAHQGIYWWEIDLSYYVLKIMSWVGLVWDLRRIPDEAIEQNRVDRGVWDVGMNGPGVEAG